MYQKDKRRNGILISLRMCAIIEGPDVLKNYKRFRIRAGKWKSLKGNIPRNLGLILERSFVKFVPVPT